MHISKKEIFIVCMLIAVALVRYFFFLPVSAPYEDSVGKKVSLRGIVIDAPDVRLTNTRLTITPVNQSSNVLVVVSNFSSSIGVDYGDEVHVVGVLETPENFITTSGNEFNYKRYLANKDIYFIIKNADVEIISRGHGSWIKSKLFALRNAFMVHIARVITPPESDLANGLLLGARGGFDADMRNEFISTGTIHIIALSGYNVTIVAEGVLKILGLFLAQTASIIAGLGFITLFVLMAGASSTAIRAGIMASLALFARMTGRTYDAGRALVIAGLAMITYDLRVLTDISFQLSFIATFGVLFITPKVVRWVRFMPARFGFREIVATTISATIAVLPILLYATGILSLVSLPTNILVLPFIPLTMLLAFLAGIVAFMSPIVALPFAYFAHLLLGYILGVIHFFASFSLASVTIQSFPLVVTLALYGLLLWWVFRKKKSDH